MICMVRTGYAKSTFCGKVCAMKKRDERGARRVRGAIWLSAACASSALLVCAVTVAAQQQALTAPTDQAAVERGKNLLGEQCGFCHGANARGGSSGPDL